MSKWMSVEMNKWIPFKFLIQKAKKRGLFAWLNGHSWETIETKMLWGSLFCIGFSIFLQWTLFS